MSELEVLLNNIDDTYGAFVRGIAQYAKKKPERMENLLAFLHEHPKASSSDVIKFVSDQPDFMEDAAYSKAS